LIIKKIIEKLQLLSGVEVFEDYDLTSMTTLGLRSKAQLFLKIKSERALIEVISLFSDTQLKYLVIGKGSNLILPEQISKPVIQLSFDIPLDDLSVLKDEYTLPGNTPLNILTGRAIKHGLRGWEAFTGIPASLGGAIWMNAGTSLGEIGSLVKEVKFLKASGEIVNHVVQAGDFYYRGNNFLNDGDIVISATLKHNGVEDCISREIIAYLRKRSKSQPLTKKTCGCTFKNIAQLQSGGTKPCVAGKVIDILGLKGLRYKDLVISPVHGNFIENHGSANQDDFLDFVSKINSRIEEAYDHTFEMEAIIYNDKPPSS